MSTGREIKFRAWDKENKVMIYSDDKNYCFVINVNGTISVYKKDGYIMHELNTESAEQYIGRKDNKRTEQYPEGQEIYEGGVIKITGRYFRKTIQEKFKVVYDKSRSWFGVEDVLHTVSLNTFNCEDDVEVISGSYDNPELLKEA